MDFPVVPDQDKIQQDILNRALESARLYPSRERPYWVQVMGIPGSGKTTLTHELIPYLTFRRPYLIDSFDSYMLQFDGYHLAPDLPTAFSIYESPARAVGFAVIHALIEQRSDVVFEHSLSYPPARDLLYYAQEHGYQIVLVRVIVPVDVAKARVKAQEVAVGRHVPESLIDERAAIGESRWTELSKISDFRIECVNDGSISKELVFQNACLEITRYVKSLN